MVVDCDLLGQHTVSIVKVKSVALTQLECTVLLLAVKIAYPVINYGLGMGHLLCFPVGSVRFWY